MVLKEFNTIEDLRRSFNECYLNYNGKLYRAYPAVKGRSPILDLYHVNEKGIHADLPEVSIDFNKKGVAPVFETPQLGWIYYGGTFYYLRRNATRQYKFGVHDSVLDTFYMSGDKGILQKKLYLDQTVLKGIQKLPEVYEAGDNTKILSNEYLLWRKNTIFQGVFKIAERKLDKFKLLPAFDDSITAAELQKLGVPLYAW